MSWQKLSFNQRLFDGECKEGYWTPVTLSSNKKWISAYSSNHGLELIDLPWDIGQPNSHGLQVVINLK